MTGALATALWAAITIVGLIGTSAYLWRNRRPPPSVVLPARSHVRKVAPKIVSGVGDGREASRGSSAVSTAPETPTSLAVEAWASVHGGSPLEARIATAQRRLASHKTFGDQALRRTR